MLFKLSQRLQDVPKHINIKLKKFKKYKKFFNNNSKVIIRIGVASTTYAMLLVLIISFNFDITHASITKNIIQPVIDDNIIIPIIADDAIKQASARQTEEIQKQLEEEQRLKEREDKINRTIAFLRKQNSPVSNYEIASIIVDGAAANNADFRVVIAIMGVESGFCKQSFNHNCFGYLNGAKYSSYTRAFNDLVPKVSRQYAARYGWDFVSMAKAYGMHNYTYHAANMRNWANSV